MKGKAQKMRGNGADHAVKLGKHSHVKAGPSYQFPGKSKMSQDLYKKVGAEAQN